MKKLMKSKQEQKDEARKAYEAIVGPAWKAYEAIVDPAYEAYSVRLREIDEEDIKIIDGKKYKLVEEEK